MRRFACIASLLVFLGVSGSTQGPALELLPVQGNVRMLAGAGGNITVQVGRDGVLLVDSGIAAMSDTVVEAIWIIEGAAPQQLSDAGLTATVTTRIHRYGNLLTIVFIINDPAYLTAPYIRESSWIADPNQVIPPYPCEITPEGTIVPAGKVPSFLPGKNDVLSECATEYGIPLEAALGGEETLYPEYIKKMKTMKVAPRTTTEHFRRAQ